MKVADPEMPALKLQLESLRDEVARLEALIRENGGVIESEEEAPTTTVGDKRPGSHRKVSTFLSQTLTNGRKRQWTR